MYHISAETRHNSTELLKLNINFQIAAQKRRARREKLFSIIFHPNPRFPYVVAANTVRPSSSADQTIICCLHVTYTVHVRPLFHISAASEHVVEISGTKHKVPKVVIIAEADISIVKLVSAVLEKLFMTDLSLDAGLMSRDPMQSHVKHPQIRLAGCSTSEQGSCSS